MDLLDEKSINRMDKDKGKFEDFAQGKLNIQVFSTSDHSTAYDTLLHIKHLFQRMLPKMPKDYILRQVFDEKHYCMTLNERIENKEDMFRIIGSVLFRPCFERNLVEIIFLAIDSEYHVSGYGTFLFNCFKETCKLQYSAFISSSNKYWRKNLLITNLDIFDSADDINIAELAIQMNSSQSSENNSNNTQHNIEQRGYTGKDNLYLLTYADNSAIGFFKKQGFTKYPRSISWLGYIKDYDGGTLMECKLHKDINYLHKKRLLEKARKLIFERMKLVNDFHILRTPAQKDEIPIIKCDDLKVRTKEDFLSDFLYFILCTLQSHPSAWPFLEPVSVKDVPDYFEVIKQPMDMSLIMKKLKNNMYLSLNDFSNDIHLMCNNCLSYNGPDTQYYKCASNIQKYFEYLITTYSQTISNWGYKIQSTDSS
ncbi:histone acetyltransferase [Glugoides intestinalis]